MADTILQILQWAIPSGGIGVAIAWIANRRIRTVEEKKKVEDTYKQMYDMVSKELVGLQQQNQANYEKIEELQNENGKTRRALLRLSRAIEAIQLCPHRAACPVSSELSLVEEADTGKPRRAKHGRGGRQRGDELQRDTDSASEGADVISKPGYQPRLPAPVTQRGGLHCEEGTGTCESESSSTDG